jgi:hypothetical protein
MDEAHEMIRNKQISYEGKDLEETDFNYIFNLQFQFQAKELVQSVQ